LTAFFTPLGVPRDDRSGWLSAVGDEEELLGTTNRNTIHRRRPISNILKDLSAGWSRTDDEITIRPASRVRLLHERLGRVRLGPSLRSRAIKPPQEISPEERCHEYNRSQEHWRDLTTTASRVQLSQVPCLPHGHSTLIAVQLRFVLRPLTLTT
jgi:hypothetical protein